MSENLMTRNKNKQFDKNFSSNYFEYLTIYN